MGDFMKSISALAIAFTYVGTIVGAGFASGQELKSYFVDFGVYGIIGLCIASFLIAFLGKKIMILCNENNISTYDGLLNLLSNSYLSKLFDFFITLFLIGTLTTMCSGMGTILKQVFEIPLWCGSLFLILFTVIVVKKGINEISKLNVIIVPILICVTIIISTTSIKSLDSISLVQNANCGRGLLSAVLYVAYNVVMSISILPALALSANKNSIIKGSKLAGLIIGILGSFISFALIINYDIIQDIEIPLAVLSNKYIGFYIVTFILEVFSTAVSSLYGVYGRIKNNNVLLYIIAIVAYCFSLFGFSNLITYLYGVMGFIGIFMILTIIKKGR